MSMTLPGCLLVLFWIQTAPGAAIDTSPFHYSREIQAAPPGLSVLRLDAAVLAHSRPDLGDLRIADAGNQQVPYLLEKSDDVLSVQLPQPLLEKDSSLPGQSKYRLMLPFENLPQARLILTTTERVFQRSISVRVKRPAVDSRSEPAWESLASSTWRHNDTTAPAPVLPVDLRSGLRTTELSVIVDEGDNRPLALGDSHLELPSYQLRFFYPQDGKLTLHYGQESLPAPRYDLELIASQLAGEPSVLALNVERESPVTPGSGEGARYVLWVALIVTVVVVSALLVRLLRSEKAAS